MSEVIVYTKSTCAPCNMVKQFLSLKKVKYEEKSTDDPSFAQYGSRIVPLTVVDGRPVHGYNPQRLAELL